MPATDARLSLTGAAAERVRRGATGVLVKMEPQPPAYAEEPVQSSRYPTQWSWLTPEGFWWNYAPYAPGDLLVLDLDGEERRVRVRGCGPVEVSPFGLSALLRPDSVHTPFHDFARAHPGQTHAWLLTWEEEHDAG